MEGTKPPLLPGGGGTERDGVACLLNATIESANVFVAVDMVSEQAHVEPDPELRIGVEDNPLEDCSPPLILIPILQHVIQARLA